MKDFLISSDSTCDLPDSYCKENNIPIIYAHYCFDEIVHDASNRLPGNEFYQKMRNGKIPTTIAPNIDDTREFFLKNLKKCSKILHIAFSSALSSTYQNACIAANDVMKSNPGCKIHVVDSLCASLGEGMLVYFVNDYAEDGHAYEDTIKYAEEIRHNIIHNFSVDNLMYLQKGGRISRTTAILGELVSIKPILHVNENGELKMYDKVRGRKKSLLYLVDRILTQRDNSSSLLMISHGDCIEDAEFIKSHVLKDNPDMNIIINELSPTIASHSGPGTIAVYYLGNTKSVAKSV